MNCQAKITQPAITCSEFTIEILEQMCEICSKLTYGGFIVDFEYISHLCSNVSIVNFELVNTDRELKSVFSFSAGYITK